MYIEELQQYPKTGGVLAQQKSQRTLAIFFRLLRGEDISVSKLATDFEVSTKSINRSLTEIKTFLADYRDLVGHSELRLEGKVYRLSMDDFLSDKELFAVVKIILASRAFSEEDTAQLIEKLKQFTSKGHSDTLKQLIRNEMYHFTPISHDSDNVIDTLWQLIMAIENQKEITISYYKANRTYSDKRVHPVSVMFSEYYFYLIAYYIGEYNEPRYFRVDRITGIVEHRKPADGSKAPKPTFDEGKLRQQSQFMFYGKLRKVKFWYTGPSLQAILDRLPTAKVIERERNKWLLEAEVFGDGIKMFLLSQGTWVQVIEPIEFVEEMVETIQNMHSCYKEVGSNGI